VEEVVHISHSILGKHVSLVLILVRHASHMWIHVELLWALRVLSWLAGIQSFLILSVSHTWENCSSLLFNFMIHFKDFVFENKSLRVGGSLAEHAVFEEVTGSGWWAHIKLTMSLLALFFFLPIPFLWVLALKLLHLLKFLAIDKLDYTSFGQTLLLFLILVKRDSLDASDRVILLVPLFTFIILFGCNRLIFILILSTRRRVSLDSLDDKEGYQEHTNH